MKIDHYDLTFSDEKPLGYRYFFETDKYFYRLTFWSLDYWELKFKLEFYPAFWEISFPTFSFDCESKYGTNG